MPRFFVDAAAIRGTVALLTGEAAAHAKVLRLKKGEEVTLCTGDGLEYLCTAEDFTGNDLPLVVREARPSSAEPKLRCSIYMAYAKSDKLEHVIQKATELGAWEIVAFPSSRCVSRPDDRSLSKKTERWQKIALGAAEQSGRAHIPTVRTLPDYSAACKDAAEKDLPLFLYEAERQHSLKNAVSGKSFTTAALMSGPEGGFSEEEVAEALQAGLKICTLGQRILRCETAPLCALSALMYAADELG